MRAKKILYHLSKVILTECELAELLIERAPLADEIRLYA
jgi:hypothetical protein